MQGDQFHVKKSYGHTKDCVKEYEIINCCQTECVPAMIGAFILLSQCPLSRLPLFTVTHACGLSIGKCCF